MNEVHVYAISMWIVWLDSVMEGEEDYNFIRDDWAGGQTTQSLHISGLSCALSQTHT